ncbi:MAG: DUF6279 family lipoprotein [Limnohabitans sp.]|jgi:hypothetical protein
MRRLGLLLAVLLLQGCSAIKLGYNQLPTLSYWWLDGQLSFSDAQAEPVRNALKNLHDWHRRSELRSYAALLDSLAQQSQSTLSDQQVCSVWDDVQGRLDRTLREAVRQAAPVAVQLGPRQLQHLARHWERKNEEWEDQWLQGDPQLRLERRVERAVDRYADFYGPLTGAQQTLVREQLQQSAWTAEWGRRDRKRRQQDLLATLQSLQRTRPAAAEAEAALLGVWQRWTRPPAAEDQQVMSRLTRQACSHLAQLHATTTAEQRQRAMRRLRAYERDLRELSP